MINKEFIPYEQALALKELGFDEPCFVYWVYDNVEITFSTSHNRSGWSMIGFKNNQMTKKAGLCTAPTYSQAFRWFREKYNLKSWIREHTVDTFIYEIRPHKLTDYREGEVYVYETHENTELACLKKLIEIVKK